MRSGRILVATLIALTVAGRAAAEEGASCPAVCGMEAEQAYHQCVEDGGTEEDCKASAATTFQSCVDANCVEEPADCEEKCEDVAGAVEHACLATCGEGEECAEKCAAARRLAAERCVEELCGEPGPGCGDEPAACCETKCRDLKRGVFAACMLVEGDGEEAKALCSERAEEAFDECTEELCEHEPEVPCEERCAATARAALAKCLADGKPEAVCVELEAAMTAQCVAKRCADPEPPCAERCAESAEAAFAECVAGGGSEEACAEAATMQREQCVAEECAAPDPTCTDRCADAVVPLVAVCVEAGFDQDFCDAQGDEAVRHCVELHCDEDQDPSCREKCAAHARDEYGRCLADGGDPVGCKETAKDEFLSCASIHCAPGAGCVARCERKAGRAERRCRKSGKSETECAEVAAAVLAQCTADKCAPEPPDTCDDACEERAADVEATCLGAGHPATECAAAEQGVLDQCAAECGGAPDETCTETCTDEAQLRYAAVLDRTGDAARAGRKSQRTFRRCERACD